MKAWYKWVFSVCCNCFYISVFNVLHKDGCFSLNRNSSENTVIMLTCYITEHSTSCAEGEDGKHNLIMLPIKMATNTSFYLFILSTEKWTWYSHRPDTLQCVWCMMGCHVSHYHSRGRRFDQSASSFLSTQISGFLCAADSASSSSSPGQKKEKRPPKLSDTQTHMCMHCALTTCSTYVVVLRWPPGEELHVQLPFLLGKLVVFGLLRVRQSVPLRHKSNNIQNKVQ